MIFDKYRRLSVMALAAFAGMQSLSAESEFTQGDWTIKIADTAPQSVTMSHRGTMVFNGVTASASYSVTGTEGQQSISADNLVPTVTQEDVTDEFGQGNAIVLSYRQNGVTMQQRLNFYDNLPYFIAQVTLSDDNGANVTSNNIVAFAVSSYSSPMTGANNRIIWVPFDNDGHVAYKCTAIAANETIGDPSHEVSAVFNTESRFGLVAGSVDHDIWKSGVTIGGQYMSRITKFECLSGLSNANTRDAIPHGAISGKTVSSARYFIGAFDDWREGMNLFAEANTKVVPPAKWDGGNPIGWSSWGVQMNYINYDGVVESARFIKDNLYDLGFHDNNGQTVISLDSFAADNIPAARIYQLGHTVFGDGTTYKYGGKTYEGTNQILGLYGGPFCIWGWTFDSKIPGTGLNGEPNYYYRDIALKVNGKPYVVSSNSAYAVDPTHPALRAHIAYFMKQYATNGAKYAKIDFINNGIVQGDSYYAPGITTAVQAYNYGMKVLLEEAEKYGIYIVESISPVFPYQYGHGRRTCCDRFSQIGESEYVMNAMSYGWWTDKLYAVNDPDQLVMCKADYKAQETDGENRARATTGMTTGAFIFGDNFSDKVVYTGDRKDDGVVGYPEESRKRAIAIMGNADINEYVRNNTGSFMPVEGTGNRRTGSSYNCETIFQRTTDQYCYVAVFNFGSIYASSGDIEFSRLGLDPSKAGKIKELWFGSEVEHDGQSFHYSVPAKDVRVYRISRTDYSGTTDIEADATEARLDVILSADNGCNVKSSKGIQSVEVYGIDGSLCGRTDSCGLNEVSFPANVGSAIAIVDVRFTDGTSAVRKAIKNN